MPLPFSKEIQKIKSWLTSDFSVFTFFPALLMAGIFIYTCLRTALISVSHDEAFTYIYNVWLPAIDILRFAGSNKHVWQANHLLNTLLAKLSINLFGLSELSLRMPALLGHGLYLLGTYKILRLFLRKAFFLPGLALMISHPFLLEYFSLARGYALGLGFLSWGIYYFFLSLNDPHSCFRQRYAVWAIFFFTLMALSQIVFLYVYFIFPIVFVFAAFLKHLFIRQPEKKRETVAGKLMRELTVPLCISLLILSVIYVLPIHRMILAGITIKGSSYGFAVGTMASLIIASLDGAVKNQISLIKFIWIIRVMVFFVMFISAVAVLDSFLRQKKGEPKDLYLFCTTTFLFAISLILPMIKAFLGIPYLVGRFGIFLIPFFMINLLILCDKLSSLKKPWVRGLAKNSLYTITIIALLHFSRCLNLRREASCASVKQMLHDVELFKKGTSRNGHPVSIGIPWEVEPCINFYRVKNKLWWLKAARRLGPYGDFDYYYLALPNIRNPSLRGLRTGKTIKWGDRDLMIIKTYELSETFLAVPLREGSKKPTG